MAHRAPLPTPKSKPPVFIGDYEILSTLGSGSFGKVKLAKHTLTGLKVAMKFISKRKIATAEMSNRVHREIQYLSLLRHPHIIKLYDVIDAPSDIVMVIEYLSGELFEYIVRRGKMEEKEARRFFQQIMGALEYCHSHNIVHRDLKPENLLLDEHLNVKIADFGLSNVMRDGDFLKTSCGSPNYAAPEVISGKLYAGPEIDIWSCGVILYVMLCGRLPFDDDHIPLLFKKINGGIFTLPPFLSPDARHILSRMLVVDSNKRIKLHEIRQLPWFTKDLPTYLFAPATNPTPSSDAEEGTTEPITPNSEVEESVNWNEGEEEKSGRRREWVEGLGIVDEEIVEDLCGKIEGLTSEDVWNTLKVGGDKELRIAYQLCRDNKRMVEGSHYDDAEATQTFYAPPGNPNVRQPSARRKPTLPLEKDDAEIKPAPIPTANTIRVLSASLPKPPEGTPIVAPLEPSRPRSLNPRLFSPLKSMTQPLTPTEKSEAPLITTIPAPSGPTTKRLRQRWHFGIRSRSEPMEVMLEIYRTLKALGMEWKPKEESNEDSGEEGEDPKRRRRREDEDRIKKAQELYFVETRCRMDDVMIRMNLQLYRIDEANYLVDFRNLGYKSIKKDSPEGESNSASSFTGIGYEMVNAADEIRSRKPSGGWRGTNEARHGKEVSSPYLFLEVAVQLISELASPAR